MGASAGDSILDACCGPGRHALSLAKHGFIVTGVDRTRAFIEEGSQRAERAGVDIEWVLADVREFVRPSGFDHAINLYTSFGYFDDPQEDLAFARNLFASLKPGGRLLIQTVGKETIARNFEERTWLEQDGLVLLQEHRLVGAFAQIETRWTMITGSNRREVSFVVRLYSAAELVHLLRQAGFEAVRVLGDLSGVPYDQNARRLVVLAHKAAEPGSR